MHTTTLSTERATPHGQPALSRDELLHIYRTMLLSRRIDDKEIQLKNQSLIYFQISGAGHEAILVAAGLRAARPAYDWFFPYYRDRALCLDARHDAARDVPVAPSAPRTTRTAAAGRCPRTGATRRSTSSRSRARPARSACTPWAAPKPDCSTGKLTGIADRADRSSSTTRSSTSPIGDGTTREGEFWESLSTACVRKLPVVFIVEDNGYAISVPVEVQTPGGSISEARRGLPGPEGPALRRHGHLREPIARCARRSTYCRERRGPALVHAKVIRPYSHSLSDDERLYKTPAERAAEATRDPITKLAALLKDRRLRHQTTTSRRSRRTSTAKSTRPPTPRVKADEAAEGHAPACGSTRPTSIRPRRRSTSHAAARGQAGHDGLRHQPDDEGRDGGEPAHRHVRRGRRGCDARREAEGSAGQGRRLQGHARPAEGLRRRIACSTRRWPKRTSSAARVGMAVARAEAGRRDPVLRLHLAGDDAAPQRSRDDAVPLEQRRSRARW